MLYLLQGPCKLRPVQDSKPASSDREQGEVSLSDLTGVWIKDRQASDLESYARALDMMRLGSLQKTTALNLIEGFELREEQGGLKLKFLTVVPFFEVSETYRSAPANLAPTFSKQISISMPGTDRNCLLHSFDGVTEMGRRDMKRGLQEASAQLTSSGMIVAIEWGRPDPGMHQQVGGQRLAFLQC